MMALAVLPPVFFRIMNPLVQAHNLEKEGASNEDLKQAHELKRQSARDYSIFSIGALVLCTYGFKYLPK